MPAIALVKLGALWRGFALGCGDLNPSTDGCSSRRGGNAEKSSLWHGVTRLSVAMRYPVTILEGALSQGYAWIIEEKILDRLVLPRETTRANAGALNLSLVKRLSKAVENFDKNLRTVLGYPS